MGAKRPADREAVSLATSAILHGFYHGSGARIKRRKKGEEKKEDFRGFDCLVLRGFARGTPPTTPDRHVPTGSAPRGRARVLLLSAESCVLFRGFIRF